MVTENPTMPSTIDSPQKDLTAVRGDTYFPALTGLRAIAAYMVFIHHYNPFSAAVFGQYIHDFFQEFHVGVTLFFVLSGFLIGFRYYDTEAQFRKYFLNRVARIYPMYFILTTITFISHAVSTKQHANEGVVVYLANITFLRGFFQDLKFTGVAQGWSLTVEETFYLLAPVLFLLVRRSKVFLFVLPLLLVGMGMLIVGLLKGSGLCGFMASDEFMFNYTFFGRCCEFFLGLGLALVVKQHLAARTSSSALSDAAATPRPAEFSQNLTASSAPRFAYFTWCGLPAVMVCIYLLSRVKGSQDFGIRQPAGQFINNLVLPLLGILPLFYGLITEHTWLRRLLSSKVMVLLGKSSYVFYLIHVGFIMGLVHKVATHNLLLNFVCLNLIAIALFKHVEEPLNLAIRRRFAERRQPHRVWQKLRAYLFV